MSDPSHSPDLNPPDANSLPADVSSSNTSTTQGRSARLGLTANARPWLAAGMLLLAGVGIGVVGDQALSPDTSQCPVALAASDKLIDLEQQVLGLASDSMTAVATLDASAVNINTGMIKGLTPQVSAAMDTYSTAKESCQKATQ